MTLRTRLIAVNDLKQGDRVGYSATWQAPEDMCLGVAAIGYGDGYPRNAAAGTPVLVRGQPASMVGRVSMDMVTVDLRQVPDAAVGDSITLWGAELPAEVIAGYAGSIAYDLTCGITRRVLFVEDDT